MQSKEEKKVASPTSPAHLSIPSRAPPILTITGTYADNYYCGSALRSSTMASPMASPMFMYVTGLPP